MVFMNRFDRMIQKIKKSKAGAVLSLPLRFVVACQRGYFQIKWWLTGARKPTPEDVELIRENATFLFKSFERQWMAKQLYRNIQRYYPGARVVIADDSKKPLKLQDTPLTVVQLPFNSGLSYGINRALEKVQTPYVVRLDDDELLTPYTRFHEQLRFLQRHPEVDIAAVSLVSLPKVRPMEETAQVYYVQTMANAPRKLKIPHLTKIDDTHVVVGKPPNIFIARTEAVRQVGYDDNIRMYDHNEFFFRAAGILVTAFDPNAYVLHRHDPFDANYKKFREADNGDGQYIRAKTLLAYTQSEKNRNK